MPADKPYFRLSLPTKTLLFLPKPVEAGQRGGAGIIMGRALFADLLSVPERRNWRECERTREEEEEETKTTKEVFGKMYSV